MHEWKTMYVSWQPEVVWQLLFLKYEYFKVTNKHDFTNSNGFIYIATDY